MEKKINTLRSLLPNSPFVTEQVGYALKYAQSADVAEEELVQAIDLAIYITELANRFSNPDFYTYRPIVSALLQVVTNEEQLEMFATETNSVLVTLAEFKTFKNLLRENTDEACTFLAKNIIDKKLDLMLLLFAYMMMEAKNNNSRTVKLQIAYISMNLILSKFEYTGAIYEAYNDMLKALNKAVF